MNINSKHIIDISLSDGKSFSYNIVNKISDIPFEEMVKELASLALYGTKHEGLAPVSYLNS